jgi:hypothetical protein
VLGAGCLLLCRLLLCWLLLCWLLLLRWPLLLCWLLLLCRVLLCELPCCLSELQQQCPVGAPVEVLLQLCCSLPRICCLLSHQLES